MYYVLVETTEGETAAKAKSVEPGIGLMAHHRIYWWFAKNSGVALQVHTRKVTHPEPIVK